MKVRIHNNYNMDIPLSISGVDIVRLERVIKNNYEKLRG